jgi:hypothetical protein
MATGSPPKPSFSRARKWGIGFNVVLTTVVVLAVAVMANYLSGNYSQRFHLSTRTRVELSPRTITLLHSLTNRVQITLYYDKEEPLYGDIAELLKEYQANNSRIAVATVDYYRDPGAVQELKAKYSMGSSTNKNLVIFDCEGRTKFVDGNALAQYILEAVPNATEREFRRKPVAFKGEMMFTGALLAVVNPKPLQAFFLQGHGEHRLDDLTESGYQKFGSILQQNYIQVTPLSLLGTNTVPPECNLLVIAGPTDPIPQTELDRVSQYLDEGGRLLVLFNVASAARPTGLEQLLARWGIRAGAGVIKDPDNTVSGSDVVVMNFANHPAVNPLIGRQLQMFLPREISKGDPAPPAGDALKIEEIVFSGPHSFLKNGDAVRPARASPLIVAVERDALKGVVPQRGATRILAIGDSLFLDNQVIDFVDSNRDFAGYAANWLLDRSVLLQGIGPRRVTEYRLVMTRNQVQTVQWVLLGAMPCGVLLFGGLVWLRRRR